MNTEERHVNASASIAERAHHPDPAGPSRPSQRSAIAPFAAAIVALSLVFGVLQSAAPAGAAGASAGGLAIDVNSVNCSRGQLVTDLDVASPSGWDMKIYEHIYVYTASGWRTHAKGWSNNTYRSGNYSGFEFRVDASSGSWYHVDVAVAIRPPGGSWTVTGIADASRYLDEGYSSRLPYACHM